MSQVVSVKVSADFERACSVFNNAVAAMRPEGEGFSDQVTYQVEYDEASYEIRCEGRLPDEVISALITVKDQFDGELYDEGQVCDAKGLEVVEEASAGEKIGILLAIVFFPVTLIYLLLRILVWLPYRIWKATR